MIAQSKKRDLHREITFVVVWLVLCIEEGEPRRVSVSKVCGWSRQGIQWCAVIHSDSIIWNYEKLQEHYICSSCILSQRRTRGRGHKPGKFRDMYFIDAPLAFINCQECDPIFSTDLRTTCLDGTLGTIQLFFFFNETFQLNSRTMKKFLCCCTAFSSEIGTKLRESAVGQAGGSCYSRAALSSNDSKMLYWCQSI